MVETKELIEITDELLEQIVMTLYPDKDIYKETPDGELRIKKKYGEVRVRIYNILDTNLNGAKA